MVAEKPAGDDPGAKEPAAEDPAEARLVFDDPRAIRALAHPARMAIIDALASGDELTATDCAALTGLTPSATAYHLKLLERYKYAEPAAPRPDGRERPWRAVARRTSVYLDSTTAAGATAAAAVTLAWIDRTRAVAAEFIASQHEEPAQWRDAGSLVSADVWLTVEETERISELLSAALDPFRGRRRDERPADSRRVRVMSVVVPHRERQDGDE
jgi:DNA-binding transcriptional ArsR family regulator